MSAKHIPPLILRGKYFTHQDLIDATEYYLRHRIKNLREQNQLLMGKLTAVGHEFTKEEWLEAYSEELKTETQL